MAYTTKKEVFEQSNTWILDLTRQILTQIERYTQPVRISLEEKMGPFNDADAHLAEIAIGMEPEPFGLAHIYQCIPYTNPKIFREDFEGAVRRGWLTISAQGGYRATEKGYQYYNHLHREIQKMYNRLRPLPIMQLERLDVILTEIITALTNSETIHCKPAFEMDLRLASAHHRSLRRI